VRRHPKNKIISSPVTTMSRPKPGAISRFDAGFQFPDGSGIDQLDHDVRAETPDRLGMVAH